MKIYVVDEFNRPQRFFTEETAAIKWGTENCDVTLEYDGGDYGEFSVIEWDSGEDYYEAKGLTYVVKINYDGANKIVDVF